MGAVTGRPPLIIIAGPTAVGKSALSVALAKRIGGEVISADSMQVYRGMDIGTAKITREEMQGVPHHLIDVLDPREPFNILRFQTLAKEAAEDILSRGRIPVVCGGTGFYIQSLLYDVRFSAAAEDSSVRERLTREMEELGPEEMHRRLGAVDPAYAAEVHPNNRKRVIRALEFHELTGQRLSGHNEEERARHSPYSFLYAVLNMDRAALYKRIDYRVDLMMRDGLLDEVKRLRDEGVTPDMISMQGLGYKQIYRYLEGDMTLEDAVGAVKQETRHFAKRQLTWFRREPDAEWFTLGEGGMDRREALERITDRSLDVIRAAGTEYRPE